MSSKNISYEQTSILQAFLELWTSYLEKTMGTTKAILEGSLIQIRDQVDRHQSFEEVSKTLDDFLRSPVFLQAMKHHVDALIQTKNNGIGQSLKAEQGETHEPAANGKRDEILRRIDGTEQKLIQRLDHIESRIEKIENHLCQDLEAEESK